MVSLATVTSRSSGYSQHIEIARANARLALVEAIALLQEDAGLDTRITASSEIYSSTQKHLTGVWLSHGDDSSTGAEMTPENVASTYTSGRSSRGSLFVVVAVVGVVV